MNDLLKSPSLFISYSSKDREIVEKIHSELESAGLNVWRDQSRLETDWSRENAFALAVNDVRTSRIKPMSSIRSAASKKNILHLSTEHNPDPLSQEPSKKQFF